MLKPTMRYADMPTAFQALVERPQSEELADNYAFRIVKEMEHSHGVAWTANIINEKKQIFCRVENMGRGGCNDYHQVGTSAKMKEHFARFGRDAKTVYPDSAEPLDAFMDYYASFASDPGESEFDEYGMPDMETFYYFEDIKEAVRSFFKNGNEWTTHEMGLVFLSEE